MPAPSLGLPSGGGESNAPSTTAAVTAAAVPKARALGVSIEGKPASVAFDGSLFWLTRGAVPKEARGDPYRSFICIPHALILYTSFVPDSDGGSLLIRLLAPPATQRGILPFSNAPTRASLVAAAERSALASEPASNSTQDTARAKVERLRMQLEGPCANLRLVTIEARISPRSNGLSESELEERASSWASDLMGLAYTHTTPHRRFKVLVNPFGGPGKALPLFQHRIRPIFEAAGCRLDVEVTKRTAHGTDIARDIDLDAYDSIVCVSGDGMLNEVLQGLANRPDANEALRRMTVAPIPTGSGNAVSVNLLGVKQGFSLSLASLNAIKGRVLPLDICTVTQPGSDAAPATLKRGKARSSAAMRAANASAGPLQDSEAQPNSATSPTAHDADPAVLASAPKLPYQVTYSFLSQAIGLMADIDLGTEDMRALGDIRFILGFVQGVLQNRQCPVDLFIKLGAKGTVDRSIMRERTKEGRGRQWEETKGNDSPRADGEERDVEHATAAATEEWRKDALGDERPISESTAKAQRLPLLRHGTVMDPIDAASLRELNLRDPSWPFSVAVPEAEQDILPSDAASTGNGNGASAGEWLKVTAPISALYGGKLPYVSRDFMQFPYALPGDGLIDLGLTLHGGGRAGKLRAISTAETGAVAYDRALAYVKCEAYRVVPHLAAGDKSLKKGGLISIDGEWRPYRPFQVEVQHGMHLNVLSLFGGFIVPDVEAPEPPKGSSM